MAPVMMSGSLFAIVLMEFCVSDCALMPLETSNMIIHIMYAREECLLIIIGLLGGYFTTLRILPLAMRWMVSLAFRFLRPIRS